MATGGTDHMIRVYYLGAETPMKVSEMDAHTVRNRTQYLRHCCFTLKISFLNKCFLALIYVLFLCF